VPPWCSGLHQAPPEINLPGLFHTLCEGSLLGPPIKKDPFQQANEIYSVRLRRFLQLFLLQPPLLCRRMRLAKASYQPTHPYVYQGKRVVRLQ
jgi:hypothetical protein